MVQLGQLLLAAGADFEDFEHFEALPIVVWGIEESAWQRDEANPLVSEGFEEEWGVRRTKCGAKQSLGFKLIKGLNVSSPSWGRMVQLAQLLLAAGADFDDSRRFRAFRGSPHSCLRHWGISLAAEWSKSPCLWGSWGISRETTEQSGTKQWIGFKLIRVIKYNLNFTEPKLQINTHYETYTGKRLFNKLEDWERWSCELN